MNFNFLKEDSSFSTMRVATIGIIILFIPVFVVCWSYVSFANKALADIPDGVNLLLTVVLGAKAIQKFAEKRTKGKL